ncbi:MAG: divergent polysaccharide deacetylase family protein [Paracoccaceae bacterium]
MTLWLLSQIGEVVGISSQPPRQVATTAPQNTAVSPDSDAETSPQTPANQSTPSTDPSRQGIVPVIGNTETPPQAGTASAQIPEQIIVADNQSIPPQEPAPLVTTAKDTPAASASDAIAPQPPAADAAPAVVTQPPEQQPDTAETNTMDSTDTPIVTAPLVPEPITPVEPSSQTEETLSVSDFSAPIVVETPLPGTPEPVVKEPAVVAEPSTPQAQENTPNTTSGVVIDRTKRAPEIATAETTTDPLNTDAEPATAEDPNIAASGPAIEQFAIEFENPEGRPILAIVLLVDGDDPNVTLAGEALPFPVTYAVDASKDNATAVMSAYRENGSEIALLAPLQEGSTPKDVEVAFQTYLAAVPQAVAVMDVPTAVFQSNRAVSTQVAQALAASGHGMLSYSRGFNSATQIAAREGVPAALVFRVFDENNRDGKTIKRFLDQAAFRASQNDGVVLVGHNRPETIAALLEWVLGNRASTLSLAPLSAVLQAAQ